ncbi:MAG: hypothetical protein KGJ06_04485, partial [Pseudomonadota bacterium]|nr:hypothetical protein [Pseudomonadota bacterium]
MVGEADKKWLWGAGVFLIAFQLHYDYLLNLFYHFGAPYFDAGLFAHLLWHNDWTLANPHLRGEYSYFCVHFSPFLLLASRFSQLIPTHMVEFYSGFIAGIYATLGLVMLLALFACFRPRSAWQSALLALAALAFAFNGEIVKGMWMPHFEYAIPLGIILFLWLYKRGHTGWSLFFFVLTLLMREDAGLHLTAILGVLAAIAFWEKRSFQAIRTELILMAYAFGYSLL